VVEILPFRHLALITGAWLVGAALRLPEPLGFSALVYGLFQGGASRVGGSTHRDGPRMRAPS